jgi:N-acylglucosamine-6-phosphate 2-epimerase
MSSILPRLRGQLIVSCQPVPGGPMDRPDIVAAFALAALAGGAAGLRIEGIANLRAVRQVTDAPVIGLVKRDLPDSPVRITPVTQDIRDLAAAGADIVAIDATARPRPEPLAGLVAVARTLGLAVMADCASPGDGRASHALGVDILGSTLSGYLGDPEPAADGPDLALLADLAETGAFVVAEGRYHRPEQAAAAIRAGASAVVAGSAITRTEHVTSWFVKAIAAARPEVEA